MDREYLQFVSDLKRNIIQSRYIAALLVNKEQLLLYFKTGKVLAEKIAAENVDLLFFSRPLQCLVAFELKRGKFKPEYAGQLNVYLNVLDEKTKLSHENPSIGIVLCKEKNNAVVEFAVKTIRRQND
jgi:hypothetical protein